MTGRDFAATLKLYKGVPGHPEEDFVYLLDGKSITERGASARDIWAMPHRLEWASTELTSTDAHRGRPG